MYICVYKMQFSGVVQVKKYCYEHMYTGIRSGRESYFIHAIGVGATTKNRTLRVFIEKKINKVLRKRGTKRKSNTEGKNVGVCVCMYLSTCVNGKAAREAK